MSSHEHAELNASPSHVAWSVAKAQLNLHGEPSMTGFVAVVSHAQFGNKADGPLHISEVVANWQTGSVIVQVWSLKYFGLHPQYPSFEDGSTVHEHGVLNASLSHVSRSLAMEQLNLHVPVADVPEIPGTQAHVESSKWHKSSVGAWSHPQ